MTYTGEISRDHPTCFLFVIDQSGSMDEKMGSRSKADFVADVLNKTLATLVANCTKADGVRSYFDIGVIAYGGNGVISGLSGDLIQPISKIWERPLRVEERTKKSDDGAGGIIDQRIKFPVWFDPTSSGGTPMCAALTKAAEAVVEWCDAHPASYPPTILHVTDGQSTDGNPEHIADGIRQISTQDGTCLFSTCTSRPVRAARLFSPVAHKDWRTSIRGCCSACRASCPRMLGASPPAKVTPLATAHAALSSTATPSASWTSLRLARGLG